MKTKKSELKKLVISALLLALGLVLPTFFHLFGAGSVMLPMHIPVLICGLACGSPYGAACGLILPYLSSILTGMPPLYPVAVSMSLELCVYGLVTGLLFRGFKSNIYVALVGGMLCGRAISGVANAILMGVAGKPYGLTAFLTSSFVTGLPGIIIQLIVVPVVVVLLIKIRLVENPRVLATA